MSVTVEPGKYSGRVRVPSSKSMMHRHLILAALAEGTTYIRNCSFSNDVKATIAALCDMGVQIHQNGDVLRIEGGISLPEKVLNCYASASTLRFLIPLAALLKGEISFTGYPSLMKRPLQEYKPFFETYELQDNVLRVNSHIPTSRYELPGNVSSQFITGLLMVLPLLEHDSEIIISEPVESIGYIHMTISCLKQFGAVVHMKENVISIAGNQHYEGCDVSVEGDYSSASYWLALGCLNGEIQCTGLKADSLQPDRLMIQVIRKAGGNIISASNGYLVVPSSLSGLKIDVSNCPDLTMALVVLAMFSSQPWLLTNASRLRLKESDRLKGLQEVFSLLGCNIAINGSDILINGRRPLEEEARVFCYNDHRLIMAAGVAATMLEKPVTILDGERVNKSYPSFFEELARLKVSVVAR